MLANIINFFVHPAFADDADRLLRVRILIAVLLTLIVQETTVFIVLALRFPPSAVIFGGSLTFLSIITSIVLLIRLRNVGSYFFCSIAAPAITLALVVVGISVSGGVSDSPVTQMMVAPVLMAYFFGGIRWGSFTLLAAVLIGVIFFVLEASGIHFLQTVESAQQMKHTRLLISMINFTFICGITFAYEFSAIGLRRERDSQQEKYIRLAKLDPLTGLANRRNFDAMLKEHLQLH